MFEFTNSRSEFFVKSWLGTKWCWCDKMKKLERKRKWSFIAAQSGTILYCTLFFLQKYLFVLSVQKESTQKMSFLSICTDNILSTKKKNMSCNLTLYFSACTTYHFNVHGGKFARALVDLIQMVNFMLLSFVRRSKIPATTSTSIYSVETT